MECGSCGVDISQCPACGGNVCTPGCDDRADDGCVCDDGDDMDMMDDEDMPMDDMDEDQM